MDAPTFPKRRRTLRSIVGAGGVSDSGLARVLKIVGSSDNLFVFGPEPSRWAITRAATDSLLNEIGKDNHVLALRPSLSGCTSFTWTTVTPQRILAYYGREIEQFRRRLIQLSDACPTPLNLILYTDEVSPGAVFRPIIKKKSHVWFIAILEGRHDLCRDDSWIPIAMLRSSIVSRLPGGLSAATRHLLRRMCLGPDAIGDAGVCIRNNYGNNVLVHLRLGRILADEDALSSLWSIKGASGTVPCGIKCTVVAKPRGARNLSEVDPAIIDITCSDPRKIILNTDSDIWSKVDMLQASCKSNKASQVLEQGFGITYCPAGILADAELRPFVSPTRSNRFDLMHILYSNGIVALEIHLFVHWLEGTHELNYDDMRRSAEGLRFPARADNPTDVFTSVRIKKHKFSFKASAGEVLGIYPVVREFIERRGLPHSVQIDSILKLFVVCDLIKEAHSLAFASASPEKVRLLAARLEQAIQKFMEAFVISYGVESVIPKHHMLTHTVEQILEDGLVLWCFAPERVNFLMKQCAEHVDNTSRMETVGLARALNFKINHMRRASGDFLHAPVSAFPELAAVLELQQAWFSRAATYHSAKIHANDVFILRGQPDMLFQVKFCALAGERKFVCLRWLHSPQVLAKHSCRWQLAEEVDVLELDENVVLHEAPCWRFEQADVAVVCHFWKTAVTALVRLAVTTAAHLFN